MLETYLRDGVAAPDLRGAVMYLHMNLAKLWLITLFCTTNIKTILKQTTWCNCTEMFIQECSPVKKIPCQQKTNRAH